MVSSRRRFRLTDIAQQVVGGFLLAGPFVVTAEVWQLASEMSALQGVLAVCLVFAIGYGALYQADSDRDPDREREVAGVPVRFVSLMLVSFGSVLILALIFDAPGTFFADFGVKGSERLAAGSRAIAIGAVFSVVGAATADTVF